MNRFSAVPALGQTLIALTCLTSAPQSGCVVYDNQDPGYYYDDRGRDRRFQSSSLLSVEWTIDGSFDSDLCRVAGALDAEVLVYDRLDTIVFQTTEPCEYGVLDLDVDPDWYDVEITLLDSWGEPITSTIAQDVSVGGDESVSLTFDFDSSLFL